MDPGGGFWADRRVHGTRQRLMSMSGRHNVEAAPGVFDQVAPKGFLSCAHSPWEAILL
jgi:hypothetical protein